MPRLLCALLLAALSLCAVKPVLAQSAVDVTDVQVAYRFGEQVNFQAHVNATAPITAVDILFRAEGESATRSASATLTTDGTVKYQYLFQQGPLRPFAPVDFWFRVTLQSGDKIESRPSRFFYIDNRFPWKTIQDGNLRLHWYTGDDTFARQARDIARSGLKKASEMLLVTAGDTLDLYIYALAADLQSAIAVGGQQLSVGGEASPDLGVALVAVSPGLEQVVEMERTIPHELTHLLTFRLVGTRYANLPLWLREGIASSTEPANPDYAEIIARAKKQNALIPLADLCNTFPPEMSRVLLAYAESESFTRFIVKKYGDSGLVRLAQAYADGLDCQEGTVRAFGNSLDDVEVKWLSGNATPQNIPSQNNVTDDLLPYVALFLVITVAPAGYLMAAWSTPNGGKRGSN